MREIKFRGKRVDNGEWIYGDYFQSFCENKAYINSTNCLEMNKLDFVEIDYGTIGQFTGLLDKNGKEIYEGDIVRVIYTKFEEDTIHEIKYFVDDYSYPAFDLNPCIDFAESNSLQYANLIYSLEVIGNINDNPELLEKNNDK